MQMQALKAAVTETIHTAMRDMQDSRGSGGSGTSHGLASSDPGPFAMSTVGPPCGDNINVRRSEVVLIYDSICRAATAARQAQRISASAARAFGDEAVALDEARGALHDLLQ